MSESSSLITPRRVQQLVSWAIVALVMFITGRTVYREQAAALEQCTPECDLIGVAGAGVDVVLSGALAVPTFSAWGVPVGIGLSLLFLMWILRNVRARPV